MKAIVVKPFSGAPDGEVYAADFKKNDIVEGRLAAVAIGQGWAVPEDGEIPDGSQHLRSDLDAEILNINAELEAGRSAALLEIEQINKAVSDARDTSIATLAEIDARVLQAREASDAELIRIAAEVEAAQDAAAISLVKLEEKSVADAHAEDDGSTRTKAKPKTDKE